MTEKLISDADLSERLALTRGPTVTKDGIEAQIVGEHFVMPVVPGGSTLTICVLLLANGFHVTGESACADPKNYDEDIGKKIARDNAFNKIWALEGYLLKERLHIAAQLAEGGTQSMAKLYLNDAYNIRELLLSIRDKIETPVELNDCLAVLDDAIQTIEGAAE